MLTQDTIDRIRRFDGDGLPVLSVYLNLRPDPSEKRSVGARLKDLLKPIQEAADEREMDREAALSLRSDIKKLLALEGDLAADVGHGLALFSCSGRDFFERVRFPRKVWDRAVADATPYVRPMMAVLDEYHRYFAVVVDRRRAWIYEFFMGELLCHEEQMDSGLRKKNFAGWYGLEEHKIRNKAEEYAHRHYRKTAQVVFDLFRAHEAELLLVGGHQDTVNAFIPFLHPYLRERVAGTFVIDPSTLTPAQVLEHCTRLEEAYERKEEAEMVQRLLDTALSGGPAVLGLQRTLDAANAAAVDLLLVQDGFMEPGVVCEECGWLGLDGETCPVCQAPTRRTPDVVDELTEDVVNEGGRVEHVLGDTPLREHRIGAQVRFPVPATVPAT